MGSKKDERMLIWLPANMDGAFLSDMLAVLNEHGYEAQVEIATYARGQKMRINATKRVPIDLRDWKRDNG